MLKAVKVFFPIALLLLFGFLVFTPEVNAHFKTDNQCYRDDPQDVIPAAHKCRCVDRVEFVGLEKVKVVHPNQVKVCEDWKAGSNCQESYFDWQIRLLPLLSNKIGEHSDGPNHPGACLTTDLPPPPNIPTRSPTQEKVWVTVWTVPSAPIYVNQPFTVVFAAPNADWCQNIGTWSSSPLPRNTGTKDFQFPTSGTHGFQLTCWKGDRDDRSNAISGSVIVNVLPQPGPGPDGITPTTPTTPATCEVNDKCSPGQCWNINQTRPCVQDTQKGWTCWKDPVQNCPSNTRCESGKGCVDAEGNPSPPSPGPDTTSGDTTSGKTAACLSHGDPNCGNCDGQCGSTCTGTCSKNPSIKCSPPPCAIILNPCSKEQSGSSRPCPGGGNQTCYAQPNGAYEWTACPAPTPPPESGLEPCTPSQSGSARACPGPIGGAQYCYVNNETGRYEWTACPSSPVGGAGGADNTVCTGSCPAPGSTECYDGKDNDGDGKRDYAGYKDPVTGTTYPADSGCTSFWDTSEGLKIKEIIPDFFNLNWFKVNVANFLKAEALAK